MGRLITWKVEELADATAKKRWIGRVCIDNGPAMYLSGNQSVTLVPIERYAWWTREKAEDACRDFADRYRRADEGQANDLHAGQPVWETVRVGFMDGTDDGTVDGVLRSIVEGAWVVEAVLTDGTTFTGVYQGTRWNDDETIDHEDLLHLFHVADDAGNVIPGSVREVSARDLYAVYVW